MANLELFKEKKMFFKRGLIPLVVFLLLIISFSIGSSSAKTDLDGKKVTYDDLVVKIKEKKSKLNKTENKFSDTKAKLEDITQEYKAANAVINNKTENENKVKELDEQISSKSSQISSLDSTINTKKNELSSLESAIKVKKEAPVELPAGQFIVGKDISPGRYKVLPIGRGANFMVYDSSGNNVVNTIIYSSSDLGVSEYVTLLSDGYIIDAHSPFKYVPVE